MTLHQEDRQQTETRHTVNKNTFEPLSRQLSATATRKLQAYLLDDNNAAFLPMPFSGINITLGLLVRPVV